MYGYIQTYRPDLRFREYDCYRSHYCGLCHVLQKRWGILKRMTLSYDLTFLLILLDALYEPTLQQKQTRCFCCIGKKTMIQYSCFTEYTADCNLLLFYLKCQDDWQDNQNVAKKLISSTLKKSYHKICTTYPQKTAYIQEQLQQLHQYELHHETDAILPAACFGRMLGEIFCYDKDIWEKELRDIGYHLGVFIYLTDAYDDLSKDRKQGQYNPFLQMQETDPHFHKDCEQKMKHAIAMAASAMERLPLIRNADLLRNILYAGVWQPFLKRKKEYLAVMEQQKQE